MVCHFCNENKTRMTIKFPEVPFQPVDPNPYPCCFPCYTFLNDTKRDKTGKTKGRKTYRVYVSLIFKTE